MPRWPATLSWQKAATSSASCVTTVTTPFSFYAGFGPAEGKFRAGIAVYTPFGSKLQYADGWEGRTSLTDIDLKSVFVQPTVSYAITDQLSVGAGLVVLAYGSVNLQRDVPLPTRSATWSWTAKPTPSWASTPVSSSSPPIS